MTLRHDKLLTVKNLKDNLVDSASNTRGHGLKMHWLTFAENAFYVECFESEWIKVEYCIHT